MDEKFQVKSDLVPNSIYYVPQFITVDQENYLIHKVNSSPKPKWTFLSNRRLQNWGGLPHPKGMITEPLPIWLQIHANQLFDLKLFEEHRPNHVLANEYLPGQGIMPHEDGPLFYPTVATISLGSHTLLNFYKKLTDNQPEHHSRKEFSLLLQPRSLVVLKHDAYTSFMHGIDEVSCDSITDEIANLNSCDKQIKLGDSLNRNTRISLTIRYVPKVLKMKLFNNFNVK